MTRFGILASLFAVSCSSGLFNPFGPVGCNLLAAEVQWKRQELDSKFRSEGVTAFDVDKDGVTDVVTGEVWYKMPEGKMHEIRKPGEYDGAKGYSNSFACFAYDIDEDEWTDLICIGFPGVPCHWFKNPGGKDEHWKQFEIWHSAANESPQFKDLTGDGKPEIVMSSEPEKIYGYLEIPAKEKVTEKWTYHIVGEEKVAGITHRYYHGLGVGDVNNDGRQDIVIPHGWWEAPEDRAQSPWDFHPLSLNESGEGGGLQASDIHVDDLDLDGDNEILMSSAHAHGVWWFENVGSNDAPKFKYHLIDDKFSQTHSLCYEDIDGDGARDLITGKRFYAHGPSGDPDPQGEVVVYWYQIKKSKGKAPEIIPHKIEEGVGTGVGTQFLVTDINGDDLLDCVLSNKKGTNVLIQKRK